MRLSLGRSSARNTAKPNAQAAPGAMMRTINPSALPERHTNDGGQGHQAVGHHHNQTNDRRPPVMYRACRCEEGDRMVPMVLAIRPTDCNSVGR
jgi:hypothetical protein